VRIVCQQLAPEIADLDVNQARTTAAIHAAVELGADLVVLPELVTSGYVFASRDEAATVAITPEHPLFSAWAAAAGGATVVGGFCEQGSDGHLYNSAVVLDSDGVSAVYRKTHLWDREKLIFEPGNDAPPVFATPHGRIGILVCYDLEFPELTRSLALRGAELIVAPTNWPLVPRPDGERPPEVLIAMAAARVNRMFVACCDRVGTERGQVWTGGTSLIDEQGWVVAASTEPGPVVADLDLARARTKTLTAHSDALSDRRPELYTRLTTG
jgi:5-aminopentanamidase